MSSKKQDPIPETEGFLSSKQAAQMLHVSPETLRRWSNQGKIDSVKTEGGHRRYARKDVLAFQASSILTSNTGKNSHQPVDESSSRQKKIIFVPFFMLLVGGSLFIAAFLAIISLTMPVTEEVSERYNRQLDIRNAYKSVVQIYAATGSFDKPLGTDDVFTVSSKLGSLGKASESNPDYVDSFSLMQRSADQYENSILGELRYINQLSLFVRNDDENIGIQVSKINSKTLMLCVRASAKKDYYCIKVAKGIPTFSYGTSKQLAFQAAMQNKTINTGQGFGKNSWPAAQKGNRLIQKDVHFDVGPNG